MDATQMISDSILESDEEENEEENENKRGRPLAKLCILKNEHIPETELPLFLGDNVLGRDPNTCTLPLPAPSISKQHATICISVYRRRGCPREVDTEALVWDLGSMNGTRKGHLKLSPNVRYALSERDSLLVADIPCQFVSCAIDTVSSQGHMRTPVSRNSGVNARLPDASGENTSTGSKECVNGGTKARVSLPNQDKRKTPVRTSCLSFEQTPTQPPGSLVPESDLDSDGERGDRKCKALVSDSDSHKSSPTCSTFLSPSNKIVPESEDESPITPSSSSSTKNRPYRCATFSKEETDVDVGRQQLKKEKALAIVDDSEEEEERAAAGGRKSEKSGQHLPVKPESNVSLTGEDELPVSTPAIFTGAIPAFDMDSDTDMEGEEEGLVTLNTNQQADQPPNTAQFHMDSDTDVDEDEDALDKVAKSVPSSADHTKPPHVIQPESITMDSDTDVDDDDDDDAAVSDAAPKAKHTADSAPSTQLKDLNLDSDTDVDEEEEEKDRGTNNARSKIDETPTRSDIKPVAVAAPHSLHLDSDTDDEAIPAPAIGEPSVASTVSDAGAGLGVLSDSDTDVDDDSDLVIPVAVSTLSAGRSTRSGALQSGSDADTDVDESSVPTAGDGVIPPDLRVDGDTDVEDKEEDFGEAGEGQIPSLQRENTPGLLVPLQQNCSTPVQVPEGGLEDVETQAFLSPSSGPLRGAIAPAARPLELSSCSDSQEDDFVLDETQSFILQTRDCNPPEDHTMEPTQSFSLESSSDGKGEQSSRGGSFQLGLTDSSHLQAQARALAMESTQAFVSVVGGVNLEDTQAYAAVSNADRTTLENDSNLEEPGRCSVMSAKEGQVDLALEATQAYISEPCSDSEDETDEDERNHAATAETQPFLFDTSSTLAVAETQPMSAFEEEESLDKENPTSSVLQHGEAAQPQKRHLSAALSVAETQPMHISEDEESDDEDLIPGPQKRKEKPLQLEEEQTQTLTNSDLSLVETQPVHIGVGETQPMATSGNEESDEEDSIPSPLKRKAKQLRPEDEQTQTLTNSDLSLVETQPVHIGVGESQPMDAGDDGESDEEDSIPGPRKRRAKPLQLEEESQPLTSSEVSAVETLPMGACEGEQSDEEDSTPGPRKRKAKSQRIQEEETQPLTHSEASTVETKTGKGKQSEAGTSGTTTRGRRGTRARLREDEEQAESSEPPKRQTRGKNKVLPTTRGGRGKPRPDEEESEEEEEVEQAKRARGKKSMRQQKDNEEKRLATERNKHAENNNLIKEQEDKLERERKEKEEQERVQAENAERLRLEQERAEKERIERERKEQEEKERADKAQKEKEEQLERERKEKEEKERLECKKAEREEKERIENERKEKEEKERLETSKRELEERLERERTEQDHQARLEMEAKEKEEREEKERKEKEEKERLQREKAEREEKERIEKERKEKEEKERLETSKRELEERLERERKEQEHQARLEREAKEKEERERVEKEKQDKEAKEKQIKEQEENQKTPARSRRAARRTIAAPCTTEPERAISAEDDVPARRTRSRSNSSNSVSSERSASSVSTRGSRGRGRGRGVKRTSGPPPAAVARSSNRRRTVAAGPTQQDSNDISPQGVLSRSNSTNSLNSEITICSVSSQSRGRGGRLRGRGRKTDSIPPINSQSDHSLTPKPRARGRKAEESSNEVKHEDDEKEKADSQQASTTRGRRRANANSSDPTADKEDPSSQECATEESLLHKRGRGQKAVKSETVEAPVAPATSDGDEAKEKRKGRKRELEANREEFSSSSSKIPKGKEKAQTTEAAEEEEAKGETKDEIGVQAKRRGRASSAQAKKNVKEPPTVVEVKEESEKMEEWAVDRRGRGRTSVVLKKKKEQQEDSGASVDQDPHMEASEPQTPTSSTSRKRQAPVDSSPVAKTPRSSSASPASSGRLRAASQTYKVLFTGVVDEDGERVLARLGGSMAKGVADMNYLVTDKVRRTVKFLCAVAKGVPIVTTHWLEKSGKSGSFLSPNAFLVKDPEQEEKFSFCLQESLRLASSQPLLQGYEIHVTKSVKPEPVYMKDIISCSGATFLPKMPSTHKPQTVVISCEEDWPLCGPALSASLPVVTAEFILTGILQQKRDLQTHTLSAPANTLQPAGGRGRSRKKT